MPPSDLDEIQHSLQIRPLMPEDYEGVVRLQRVGYDAEMEAWTWAREEFEGQLRRFPEGQLGAEYDGRLIGTAHSLIIDFDEFGEVHAWSEITAGGSIRNHDPEGDTLYGIEVVVDPAFRGMRIGRRLYEARKALARRLNLRRIVIGGRLPGYHRYADEFTIHEYVERVLAREIEDPVVTFQMSNGFTIKRLVTDYLPEDTESHGHAALMEWVNLQYSPAPNERHRPSLPVRVCAVQYQMRKIEAFEDFAQQCDFFVDTAAGYHADFVVFPEIFTLQLLSFMPQQVRGQAIRQLAGFNEQFVALFQGLALRYAVNVVAGSTYVEEEGELYNVSYLFGRDGSVDKQYKLHITPGERHWWGVQGGSAVRVFDTDRGKVAIAICYDVEFPELARIAAAKGAQVLFVPFCTDNRQGYLRVRYCAQARAVENQLFVVTAGCTGNLPSVENTDVHYAQSSIFTPSDFPFARDGIAAECEPNVEALLTADLDLEVLRRNRLDGTVRPWADRRRDLYEVVEKDGAKGDGREGRPPQVEEVETG
jgi:predicted amidohydrolase/GNAT superfamily N-acetyltransferase